MTHVSRNYADQIAKDRSKIVDEIIRREPVSPPPMSETNTNPEARAKLAQPSRDTIALYLQRSCGFTLGAAIANAEDIIAALAAEGMVIVPKEPTDEMITAMSNADECGYSAPHVGNYKDMYRAALTRRQTEANPISCRRTVRKNFASDGSCRADSSASSPAIASSRCHHSTAEGRDDDR